MNTVSLTLLLLALNLTAFRTSEITECELLKTKLTQSGHSIPENAVFTVVQAGFCIPCHKHYHQELTEYANRLVMVTNKSFSSKVNMTRNYADTYKAILIVDTELSSQLSKKHGLYKIFNPCE